MSEYLRTLWSENQIGNAPIADLQVSNPFQELYNDHPEPANHIDSPGKLKNSGMQRPMIDYELAKKESTKMRFEIVTPVLGGFETSPMARPEIIQHSSSDSNHHTPNTLVTPNT